ncbi:hypothetical protein [Persephonella sp. KM09-Lau-8]|uniref:hypothetical protein n=1 Tax=Persephonella sp. KM09-Lau-8 TaxID=1158345 RepID=UPI00049585FC|nr:hypothetical protein [Persephonella sp. KM09-Lau-8]
MKKTEKTALIIVSIFLLFIATGIKLYSQQSATVLLISITLALITTKGMFASRETPLSLPILIINGILIGIIIRQITLVANINVNLMYFCFLTSGILIIASIFSEPKKLLIILTGISTIAILKTGYLIETTGSILLTLFILKKVKQIAKVHKEKDSVAIISILETILGIPLIRGIILSIRKLQW